MDEFFKNVPHIINAAASSPLALAALVILTIGFIAFFHFRKASEWVRISAFFLTGIGLLILFGMVLINSIIREEFSDDDATNLASPVTEHVIQPQPASFPDESQNPSDEILVSNCVTDNGNCPLILPPQLPKGSPCTCYTIFGQELQGIAQ